MQTPSVKFDQGSPRAKIRDDLELPVYRDDCSYRCGTAGTVSSSWAGSAVPQPNAMGWKRSRYPNTEAAPSRAPNPQHDSVRTTMTHDDTPLRVFKISELARVIASQVILISKESAVNLARTCRCLEEPVLSTLWETQELLSTLLKVLPEANWDIGGTTGDNTVRGLDLPVEGLNA